MCQSEHTKETMKRKQVHISEQACRLLSTRIGYLIGSKNDIIPHIGEDYVCLDFKINGVAWRCQVVEENGEVVLFGFDMDVMHGIDEFKTSLEAALEYEKGV